MSDALISRRSAVTLVAALGAAALALPGRARAAAAGPDLTAELMAPGPLADIVLGSPDAPATIVEYASMTCSHCAHFHATVWPQLKTKYVDSGKAKFILREFPLDPLAALAFMFARCAGPERRAALVDALFDDQPNWAFVDKPLAPLKALVQKNGLSAADIAACMKRQDLLDQVRATGDRAAKVFGVEATPTFFVNGRKLEKGWELEDFDAALAP